MNWSRSAARGRVGIALAALLLVAACETGEDAGDQDRGGGQGLPTTVSSTDAAGGVVTVDYPPEWTGEELSPGVLVVTNDDALLTSVAEAAPTGDQVVLNVFVYTAGDAALLGQNATEVITGMIGVEGSGAALETAAEPEAFEVEGRQGAYIAGVRPGAQSLDGAIAVIALPDGSFGYVDAAAAEGQIGQHADQIRSIAGSINYASGAAEPDNVQGEGGVTPQAPQGQATAEATDAGGS
jgi:hypothetical protein